MEKAVEPDVVLRFSVGDPPQEIVLIVECKLGGLQYPDQWAQEWIAYQAENASESGASETCLLALGGLSTSAETMVDAFTKRLHETHGITVRAAAADWHDLLKALGGIEVTRASDGRVLADVRAALALHGYSQFTPMSSLGAIASGYRMKAGGMDRLRWTQDVQDADRSPHGPDQAEVGDPLLGWVERVTPYRPIRDHRNLLLSLADA